MKKRAFVTLLIIVLSVSSQAQEVSKNALGLRLGDNDGFGGEVSYQRGLSESNRLEFDLGWRSRNNLDALKLTGIYQWLWKINNGFNWYAGFGGGLGSWQYETRDYDDEGAFFFASANIGIEYLFDIPLQVAIDFRPEIYLNPEGYRDDNFGPDVALGVRYRF